MADALGHKVSVGDTMLWAHTGKSAGIRWSRHVVTRVTDYSFWSEKEYNGKVYEDGPHVQSNGVVISGETNRPLKVQD